MMGPEPSDYNYDTENSSLKFQWLPVHSNFMQENRAIYMWGKVLFSKAYSEMKSSSDMQKYFRSLHPKPQILKGEGKHKGCKMSRILYKHQRLTPIYFRVNSSVFQVFSFILLKFSYFILFSLFTSVIPLPTPFIILFLPLSFLFSPLLSFSISIHSLCVIMIFIFKHFNHIPLTEGQTRICTCDMQALNI